MPESTPASEPDYCDTKPGKWVKVVRAMIRELDFGEVQLTVHRGEVVEARKLEKIRFDDAAGAPRRGA